LIAAWRTGFVMEFITSTNKGDHDHTVDGDSATRNPCLVRAFFEQKSEPQNELVFFMRGHKDELSTDLSAVSSSSSSSSASSSSQSTEGGVVALLEKLVYITDTLFAGFAGMLLSLFANGMRACAHVRCVCRELRLIVCCRHVARPRDAEAHSLLAVGGGRRRPGRHSVGCRQGGGHYGRRRR
jgi:hypothetical protein